MGLGFSWRLGSVGGGSGQLGVLQLDTGLAVEEGAAGGERSSLVGLLA